MKEFKFKEFVESLDRKLDSIHGNKGLDEYSLIVNKEAVEDKYQVDKIKELSKITKEDLFLIDKGGADLITFFDSDKVNEEDVEQVGFEDFIKIKFEGGVNFYYDGGWWREFYMNVRRIILPPKKTITVSKNQRLFILQWFPLHDEYGGRYHTNSEFYKLPYLKYPSSIKDLLKWLEKKEKIKVWEGRIYSLE